MTLARFTSFLVAFVFTAAFASAQANYYTEGKDKMYTEEDYISKREEAVLKIQAVSKKLKFYEMVNSIRQTTDSVIYQYEWVWTDNVKKMQKEELALNSLIGKPFPLEERTTLDGQTLSLEDLKGKPTLINFWFVGCAPCAEEMPALNEMKKQNKSRFNLVSITLDKRSKVEKFLEKREFIFYHIIDAKDLLNEIGMNSYPVNIFLDKNGSVYAIEGAVSQQKQPDGSYAVGDGSEFVEILERLL